MKDLLKSIKERVEAELKLCQIKDIDEYKLGKACGLAIIEHLEAITSCAVAEYFLLTGDYEKAKHHNKVYIKILKDLQK